jgi:hypothetical protein
MDSPETVKRLEALKLLEPFRKFTEQDKVDQLRHIDDDAWLYAPHSHRFICSLLGALHQEIDRPDLKDLILECVWMARRMNDTKKNQSEMWKS